MAVKHPVIIVGAGQSGLAVAWYLKQKEISFIVLEANEKVGDNWRHRWQGLRLFSPARYDSLPGMAFPASPWYLPNKDEAGNYLEAYAEKFELPVKTGVQVDAVTVLQGLSPENSNLEAENSNASLISQGWPHKPPRFELSTSQGTMSCDHLIIASGSYRTPLRPVIPGIPEDLPQLHSFDYRTGDYFPKGKILVVGAGASGQQIASLLAADREVVLSGPKVHNLPRRILGRDVYWWMYKTGVVTTRRDTRRGRKMFEQSKKQGDISVGESKKRQKELGIQRLGRFIEWRDGKAILDTCTKTSPNSTHPAEHVKEIEDIKGIVWATGYKNDYSWIKADVVGEDGEPDHLRGVSNTVPGLYFIGLKFQYRVNSATLGGVGRDAEYLAGLIG